jgi:hypothetical protein
LIYPKNFFDGIGVGIPSLTRARYGSTTWTNLQPFSLLGVWIIGSHDLIACTWTSILMISASGVARIIASGTQHIWSILSEIKLTKSWLTTFLKLLMIFMIIIFVSITQVQGDRKRVSRKVNKED